MHRYLVPSLLLLPLALGEAAAQIPLTPRALGMGGAYVATARGFESIHYNPAHLALPGAPAWSVAFPQLSVGSSVLGPDVSDLPDFLDYDDLSEQRRQELLALIPAGGTAVDVDVRAPLASVHVGSVGVGLSYGAIGEHTLGKDLVELFFEGYQEGRFDYSVGNTVGTRATFWDLALGYGRQAGPVSVGVTGHYYRGRSLVRTRAFEPEYDLLGRDISVDYVGVESQGGSGYGIDVGVALQPIAGLTLSAAVANALTGMSWDDELVGRRLTLSSADFENSELADLEDRYQSSEQELGATPTGDFAAVAAALDRDAYDLPTTLRLGAAWQAPTGTEIGAAYHGNLSDGLLGGRWDRLLGLGIQQRLPLLALRLGASTDLDGGSILGGGVKLGPVDVGLARFRTAGELDDADRDGWAASFGLSVSAPSR